MKNCIFFAFNASSWARSSRSFFICWRSLILTFNRRYTKIEAINTKLINVKIAECVCHQGGETSISKVLGAILHLPSEFAAFTLKLYVPGGILV